MGTVRNVHNGSRFSGTIGTIQDLEPEAEVITDGFTVSEQDVAEAAGDVADWLCWLQKMNSIRSRAEEVVQPCRYLLKSAEPCHLIPPEWGELLYL